MRIAILTTTFYKSRAETRFHLAAQMIGNAKAMSYPTIIVDGSPDASVSEALSGIGAWVFRQTVQGIGPSRRELFERAGHRNTYGHGIEAPDIFVWTEPEKVDLIRHIPSVVQPIVNGEADIVIPARTGNAWVSWPAFQADLEKGANRVYREVTGFNHDVMLGPVAFARELLPTFIGCNPKESFGAHDTYIQHIAPLEAAARGARLLSVPVDIYYPAAQRAEEMSSLSELMLAKRQAQFDECTDAFRKVAAALKLNAPR